MSEPVIGVVGQGMSFHQLFNDVNDASKIEFPCVGEVSSEQLASYMDHMKNAPCITSYAAEPLSEKTLEKYRKSLRKFGII